MIALLIFITLTGAVLFLARQKLQNSPFREYWFLSWGITIEAPKLLENLFTGDVKTPDPGQKLPPEIMQFPPAYLAMLINRDHLCRPLMAAIIDLAVRGLLKLTWKTESEELVLSRMPVAANDIPNKLDRALLGKLFPNESQELPIGWRNADSLGTCAFDYFVDAKFIHSVANRINVLTTCFCRFDNLGNAFSLLEQMLNSVRF